MRSTSQCRSGVVGGSSSGSGAQLKDAKKRKEPSLPAPAPTTSANDDAPKPKKSKPTAIQSGGSAATNGRTVAASAIPARVAAAPAPAPVASTSSSASGAAAASNACSGHEKLTVDAFQQIVSDARTLMAQHHLSEFLSEWQHATVMAQLKQAEEKAKMMSQPAEATLNVALVGTVGTGKTTLRNDIIRSHWPRIDGTSSSAAYVKTESTCPDKSCLGRRAPQLPAPLHSMSMFRLPYGLGSTCTSAAHNHGCPYWDPLPFASSDRLSSLTKFPSAVEYRAAPTDVSKTFQLEAVFMEPEEYERCDAPELAHTSSTASAASASAAAAAPAGAVSSVSDMDFLLNRKLLGAGPLHVPHSIVEQSTMPTVAQLEAWIDAPGSRSHLVKYFVLRGPFTACSYVRWWDFAGSDDGDKLVEYRASLVRAQMDVFAILTPVRGENAVTQSMDQLCTSLLRPLHELPQFVFVLNPHSKQRVTVSGGEKSMMQQRDAMLAGGLQRMRGYLSEPQPLSSAMDQFGVGHRDHVQRCTKHLSRTTAAIYMHTRAHEDTVLQDSTNRQVNWNDSDNVSLAFPAHALMLTLRTMLRNKIDMRLRNVLQHIDTAYNAMINFLFQCTNNIRSRAPDAPALQAAMSAIRQHCSIDHAQMLLQCADNELDLQGANTLRSSLISAIKAAVNVVREQCGPQSETPASSWEGKPWNLFWRHLTEPPCPWLSHRLPRMVQTAVVQVASAQRRHALLQLVLQVHHFFMAPMPWGRNLSKTLHGEPLATLVEDTYLPKVEALLEQVGDGEDTASPASASTQSAVAAASTSVSDSSVPVASKLSADLCNSMSRYYANRVASASKLSKDVDGGQLMSAKDRARISTAVRTYPTAHLVTQIKAAVNFNDLMTVEGLDLARMYSSIRKAINSHLRGSIDKWRLETGPNSFLGRSLSDAAFTAICNEKPSMRRAKGKDAATDHFRRVGATGREAVQQQYQQLKRRFGSLVPGVMEDDVEVDAESIQQLRFNPPKRFTLDESTRNNIISEFQTKRGLQRNDPAVAQLDRQLIAASQSKELQLPSVPAVVEFNCEFIIDPTPAAAPVAAAAPNQCRIHWDMSAADTTAKEIFITLRTASGAPLSADAAGGSADHFHVSLYPSVWSDLQSVLSHVDVTDLDSPAVFPIFIPSRGRFGTRDAAAQMAAQVEEEAEPEDTDHMACATAGSAAGLSPALTAPRANPWLHELSRTYPANSASNGLVFMLVEEQELDLYRSAFADETERVRALFASPGHGSSAASAAAAIAANSHSAGGKFDLILVSIPGNHRGVGFARSMCVMLQQFLRRMLPMQHPSARHPFDHYWMIDDDFERAYVNVRDSVSHYRRCHGIHALTYAQVAFCEELRSADGRLAQLEAMVLPKKGEQSDLAKKLSKWHATWNYLTSQLDIQVALIADLSMVEIKKRTGAIQRVIHAHDLHSLQQHLCAAVQEAIQKSETLPDQSFVDQLLEMPAQLDSHLSELKKQSLMQLSQMSIATRCGPRSLFGLPKVDYNGKAPRASHRVSNERYACVLNYAPALEGFNYLCPRVDDPQHSALLRTQSQVSVIENSKQLLTRKYNGYLGEDSDFIARLARNGRGGFQLYAFNIDWGTQVAGGCFEARKKSGIPALMYGQK